jgi:hypothetical protein
VHELRQGGGCVTHFRLVAVVPESQHPLDGVQGGGSRNGGLRRDGRLVVQVREVGQD